MTLTPVSGHFGDQPDFDHVTAEAVFATIMKMDQDEAGVYVRLLVGGMLALDQLVHQSAIAKAVGHSRMAQATALSARLARAAIAKGLSGEDVSAELDAVELLAKAFDAQAFSPQERAQRARNQHRDLHSGRFVVQHERIAHIQQEPVPDAIASRLGIPAPGKGIKLTDQQRAEFQGAYHQVQALLAPYSRLPKKEGVLHLVYGDGSEDLQDLPVGGERLGVGVGPDVPGLDPTRKLTAVKVSVIPHPDAPGAAFSTFNAAGLPGVGAIASGSMASGGVLHTDTLRDDFEPEWNRRDIGDEFNPANRVFRRLGAGSKLVNDTLGDAAPAKLKMALAVGQHVGSYGPEAQKVIGPTADRAAYRYRGTERVPDQAAVAAVESIRRDPRLKGPDKREVLIYGVETDEGWNPSGLLRYLRRRLPRPELNTLQRRSGTIPPSEGVILDKTGKITVQAVGYGDDHYLPFNLKHLAGLRGGEYVRTRSFGGPTTEDVYTGLMAGARAVTVASHNGVYTMEFDPTFTGGRRYSQQASRMVGRYGQLLDAVKNGDISSPLDPSRMAELAQAADREYPEDRQPEEYAAELDRLVVRERKNPKLSAQQAGQAAGDFFTDQAARMTTPDGHQAGAPELVLSWALQNTADDYAKYNGDYINMTRSRDVYIQNNPGIEAPDLPRHLTREDFAGQAIDRLRDPNPLRAAEKLADAMGLRRSFDAHMKRAEEVNRAALRPMSLNGEGYQVALDALQEQFPYYIQRVAFHPWVDGNVAATDTGYVKARHLRPDKVLAGYFDRSIGGGKVLASTIRFQNGRAVPVPYQPGARGRETARPTGPSGGQDLSGPVDPEVAAALAQQADRELVAEIRSHATFSPNVIGTPEQRALASQPVADYLGPYLTSKPALKHLLEADDIALDSELRANPAGFHASLTRAVKEVEEHNLFDLNEATVRNHRNEGKPDPVRHLNNEAAKALNDPPGTEYDFGDSTIFNRGTHTPGDVETTYINDARIRDLIEAGDLPPHPGEGEQFTSDARALRASLQAAYTARLRWLATPGFRGPEPVREHELNRRAEGLLRAEQLRRRYMEAQQRATSITPADAMPLAGAEVHFHGFDPTTMQPLNSDGGTFRDRNGLSYTGD